MGTKQDATEILKNTTGAMKNATGTFQVPFEHYWTILDGGITMPEEEQ